MQAAQEVQDEEVNREEPSGNKRRRKERERVSDSHLKNSSLCVSVSTYMCSSGMFEG